MQILYCFLSLFLLSGLIAGSMDSEFLIDIFGNMGDDISIYFGLPLLYLIRNYFKEIKTLLYILLFFLSIFSYIVIASIVID
ncbi:hypothetical protein [Sporosarcina sp. Marseille-Q4943]|uniref:hypothetical protein n=1 Tax=Sporosarcina sp. Marseille-Q4943 TaxID=2942204 RepID=UPI00208DCDAC|nr:hypothetical protein [Sporosarcina sp. Marseille-Q4943]